MVAHVRTGQKTSGVSAQMDLRDIHVVQRYEFIAYVFRRTDEDSLRFFEIYAKQTFSDF